MLLLRPDQARFGTIEMFSIRQVSASRSISRRGNARMRIAHDCRAGSVFDLSGLKPANLGVLRRFESGLESAQLDSPAGQRRTGRPIRARCRLSRGIPGGVGRVGAQHRRPISMRSRSMSARATGESGNASPNGRLSIIGRTKAGATAFRTARRSRPLVFNS